MSFEYLRSLGGAAGRLDNIQILQNTFLYSIRGRKLVYSVPEVNLLLLCRLPTVVVLSLSPTYSSSIRCTSGCHQWASASFVNPATPNAMLRPQVMYQECSNECSMFGLRYASSAIDPGAIIKPGSGNSSLPVRPGFGAGYQNTPSLRSWFTRVELETWVTKTRQRGCGAPRHHTIRALARELN
jgi:hypothetical protein